MTQTQNIQWDSLPKFFVIVLLLLPRYCVTLYHFVNQLSVTHTTKYTVMCVIPFIWRDFHFDDGVNRLLNLWQHSHLQPLQTSDVWASLFFWGGGWWGSTLLKRSKKSGQIQQPNADMSRAWSVRCEINSPAAFTGSRVLSATFPLRRRLVDYHITEEQSRQIRYEDIWTMTQTSI